MKTLIINHKSWSCRVFPKYYEAISKAQKFLEDVNLDGELGDCIYGGNGTIGFYCIVYLYFNTFILSVNLNIENGNHRIDTTTPIPQLSKQYGNYCNYNKLIEKVKEIKDERHGL